MTLQGRIFKFHTFGFRTGIGGFPELLVKYLSLFFVYELRVEGCLTLQGRIFKIHDFGFKMGVGGFMGSLIKKLAMFFCLRASGEGLLDPSRSNF